MLSQAVRHDDGFTAGMTMGSAKPGGLYRNRAYSASKSEVYVVRENETLSFGELRTGCFAQSDIPSVSE